VTYVYTLHAATRDGKLCPHFRNSNRADGYENNLTNDTYCKVCSNDRNALEKCARGLSGRTCQLFDLHRIALTSYDFLVFAHPQPGLKGLQCVPARRSLS
jgi:hypothetical protein